MKINDEFIVNIEKLSNLGTGIARIDGQVVFVENACPQDELKIRISKVNKNFATAKAIEIITPSPYRQMHSALCKKFVGHANYNSLIMIINYF